jgi:glycosyltransferase involved in cell wall biosynthesis
MKILEQSHSPTEDVLVHQQELVNGFVKGRVSVIMPAFNEAGCIRNSIVNVRKKFSEVFSDYEIIVVDDGSTDGTRNVAESFVENNVRVISYDRNEGKGHAFRTGFYKATGEFTFLVDGDSEIMAKDLASTFSNDYSPG